MQNASIENRRAALRILITSLQAEENHLAQAERPPPKAEPTYPAPRMQYQHTQREMIIGTLSQSPHGYPSLGDLWEAIKEKYGERLNPNSFQSVVSELKAKGAIVRLGPAVKLAA